MNTKRNTRFLKPIVLVAILSTGSLFHSEVNAQMVKEQTALQVKNDLMVDFYGKKDEYLVFDVSFNQPNERKLILRITDQEGHQLYSEALLKNVYSRRILIAEEDIDKLTFSLQSSKDEVKKIFTVKYVLKETLLIKEIAD